MKDFLDNFSDSKRKEIQAAINLLWEYEITPARYAYYYKYKTEQEEANEMLMRDDGYGEHQSIY